jgi:GNAT superfamily N-acetyltransferase
MPNVVVEPATPGDVVATWRDLWNGEVIFTPRGVFSPRDVVGLAARDRNNRMVGLATYAVRDRVAAIVTINAMLDGNGVATVLLERIIAAARAAGATALVATLTNDNLRAFAFFQKRGFRLTALRPGAMDAVRARKPKIPLAAPNGIPIRDYIDVERDL